MPRTLKILGNLCLTAQRALAPAQMSARSRESSSTWAAFYSERAPSKAFAASAAVFTVSPSSFSLPRAHGPRSVDQLESLSQYAEQCIWDPTVTGTTMAWKDSTGVSVNPFEASRESIVDSFVEKLPENFRHFQWMNAWPGEPDVLQFVPEARRVGEDLIHRPRISARVPEPAVP